MANPTPIIFTLTNAGLNAALNAQNNGLQLKLSKVAVGTGKYNSATAQGRTALATKWGEFALAGAGIEPNSKTLRFSAIIKSTTKRDVFEIGLLTDTGILFAVASTTTAEPLFNVGESVDYVGAFGMSVAAVPIANVQVVVDTNQALAIALINQHLGQPDPHSQYAMRARTLTAGNGLTGGGNFAANRTLSLGMPGKLGATTTNAVTTDSHTHALDTTVNNLDATLGRLLKVGDFGIGKHITIPNNADFNTYITPGTYTCDTNATATTLKNMPWGVAGRLIVTAASDKSQVQQIYITYQAEPRIYFRGAYGNTVLTWGTWQYLFHSGNLNPSTFVPKSGNSTVTGDITMNRLRLVATNDASETSTAHALQIGPTNGTNLIIDNNEIIGRNNGALSKIFIGGGVGVGATPANGFSGDGSNITNIKYSNITGAFSDSRRVIAGNGLTGGGDLKADRTINLGTPSTINMTSKNLVTGATHTHSIQITKQDLGLGNVTNDQQAKASIVITAGNGLTGGGALTGNRTLSLDQYTGRNKQNLNYPPGTTLLVKRGDYDLPTNSVVTLALFDNGTWGDFKIADSSSTQILTGTWVIRGSCRFAENSQTSNRIFLVERIA